MSAHDLAYSRGTLLIDYGREIEQEIAALQNEIDQVPALGVLYGERWLALKLLEDDQDIMEKLTAMPVAAGLLAAADKSRKHLSEVLGDDVEVLVADRRYGYVNGLVRGAVKRPVGDRLTLSDRIDRIVTSRILGIPIFLVAMWIVFQMTANVSAYYLDWVDGVIGGPITNWISAILGALGLSATWVESLFLDGIVAGVGGVLVFVPVLLFLYFFLALLEDSGYMARAAFVMDRLMARSGACTARAFCRCSWALAARFPPSMRPAHWRTSRTAKLTAFLVPLMSCGARLPVYTLFAAAFFADNPGRFIFAMYLVGIVLAIVTGVIAKKTVYKNKPPAPFVMELPPYRLPTLRSVWTHMGERSALFLKKAATIIMAVSVLLWFLMNIPWGVENPRDSLFGKASAAVAPIFAPAGFGTWQASGSLITGFVAKEVVVSTMSQAYAIEAEEETEEAPTTFFQDLGEIVVSFGEATWDTAKATISLIPGVDLMGEEAEEKESASLVAALQNQFTPLQAVAFNLFVLLYAPCMVVIAAARQEFGTRWMLINNRFFDAARLGSVGSGVSGRLAAGFRLVSPRPSRLPPAVGGCGQEMPVPS